MTLPVALLADIKLPNMSAAIYENAAADAHSLAVLAEMVAADMEAAGISATNTRRYAAARHALQSRMEALRDAARGGDAA